jgi:predicted transposase YbfD/YdcC
VAQGGDSILAAKGDQPDLFAEVRAAFTAAEVRPTSAHRKDTTEGRDHGRHEYRTVQVLPAAEYLSGSVLGARVGLLTLVMATRVVTCGATGVTSTGVSYFISGLRPNARRIGAAIRGHWGIGNGLHWVPGVVFREDARRLYDRIAAENTAFLNRLAISLLRGDPSKRSLKVKRKRAGRNMACSAELLGFPGI